MTERAQVRTRLDGINVPLAERLATALLGGVALALGARWLRASVQRRPAAGGMALIAAGTIALGRAIAGRCPVYRTRARQRGGALARRRAVGAIEPLAFRD